MATDILAKFGNAFKCLALVAKFGIGHVLPHAVKTLRAVLI